MLEERLRSALQKREDEGNLRKLTIDRAPVDFFSNDYLGLSANKELQERINSRYNAIADKKTGSTGSRLLSGNHQFYINLETKLASILKGEKALVFNSGYSANVAVFSSIPQKGDTIIYDELIHACIKEGARLSYADRYSFRHNDMNDLEAKLQKAKGMKFIAVESVYSMDGDSAPLEKLAIVAKKYQAYLIVDEAHGTGVFGENGNGLVCALGLENDYLIRTYTFGKAMGSHGACVVSSNTVVQYLVNFARSFIYTTAQPLHNLISIEMAFDYLASHHELQQKLSERISLFKSILLKIKSRNPGLDYVESKSAIQAILVPGNEKVKRLAKELFQQGFDVRPILSPTVAEGKERLRICLHVYNTREHIERFLGLIQNYQF